MNKFLQKLAKIFLGLSMAAGVGVAIGSGSKDIVSASAAAGSYITLLSGSYNSTSKICTWTIVENSSTKVTVTQNKANASSAPANYTSWNTANTSTMRFYQDNVLAVVASSGNKIAGVKITGSDYSVNSSAQYYANTSWSGGSAGITSSDTTNLTLTNCGTGLGNGVVSTIEAKNASGVNGIYIKGTKQTRPAKIEVKYVAEAITHTVTINVNNSSYGKVDKTSVTNVADNANISASGAVLTVGSTTVTATPNAQSDQYTYAFSNWSGIPAGGKVTGNITVTANFTATTRTYNVTNSVSNASFTGANTVTYGTAYSGTFTANSGYILPASLTSVTIKGTATNNYSYNSTTGVFSIAAQYVTGAIVITGACEETGGDPVGITYSLSNCTIPGKPTQMYPSQEIELTIVPDDHYKLPTEAQNKVSVTGASDWVYNDETGKIMIDGADGAVSVSVECVAKAQNTISMGTLIGVSQASGNPTSVEEGASVTLTFTANGGYALPTSTGVSVSGTGSSFSWVQGTGKLTINGGAGNITVSITGITRTVTSITISANSGSYELGDAFVVPTVTANFNVGASEDVTAQATASGDGLVDGILTKTGSKTITISYGGQSQTYTATINAASISSAKYVKITSAPTDWSGTYLIVTDAYSKAMDGTATSNTGACKAITISDSAVTSTTTVDTYSFTIAKGTTDSTKYTVKTHSGYYIDRPTSGSGGGLTLSSSTAYELSIVYSTDHVEIRASSYTSSTKQVLQWNNSSSIFKFYTSAQGAIQLYKYQPATVKTLKWITAEVKSGTYYQGSSVSASDFTVTAHYNDGTTSTPTSDITVTNGYLSNVGANTVTLTYGGKSYNVSVTAVEQTAEYTGLSWAQGEYAIINGREIDFSKLGTVTAEYDDGDAYASKPIASCGVATYTKSGDVYTKVSDLADGDTITSSSHGKYLGVTYTETNTFTAYSSAPIYVIESIEDVFVQEKTYAWTKVSSIAVGDTVLLTGTKADGTAPHELSDVTSNSGTIASFSTNPAGTYRLTVVAGASSGSFAFKDADDNYLYHNGTDKTLSLSDELTDASSWTVEFDSETPTKATVTNVDSGNPLQYNPGNYFRVYASASQQPIQFYKGESSLTPTGDSIANTNVAVQKAVLEFAAHFNETMACVNGGTTSNVSGKWTTLSGDFTSALSEFTDDDLKHFKDLFANAYSVEGGDTLQDMLARYDYIVAKYKLSDFLKTAAGRAEVAQSPRVSPLVNIIGENTNTVAIIVIISMVSVTAIGGYFFLRKRKEQ